MATIAELTATLDDVLNKYGERNPDPEGGCLARVTIAARDLVAALERSPTDR